MNVLVTGASGYIGRVLCRGLALSGHNVQGVGRSQLAPLSSYDYMPFDLEGGDVDELVKGKDCIVHLAGRAHMIGETGAVSNDIYRQTNSELSVRIARAAIKAGVRRFVFISSIGVNGTFTFDKPFNEESTPAPKTPYAISKYAAENELRALASTGAIELVVIRPPLVYAGNAPGNFLRLMKLVSLGVPLPFGAVANSRSMISLENLVDFIQVCAVHPAASNELFLIADSQNFSTPEIIRYLAEGMHKNIILLPSFDFLLRPFLSLIGKKAIYDQLYGSLVVDSSKAKALLGWTPPFDGKQCLVEAGGAFTLNTDKKPKWK